MENKELYNKSVFQSVGVIGEFAFTAGGVDYHVGDIVTFEKQKPTDSDTGVVTEDVQQKLGYGVCGAYTRDARQIGIKKVLPYTLLTQEILSYHKDHLIIREVEVKEMTVKEIEEELGYKIKIVGE